MFERASGRFQLTYCFLFLLELPLLNKACFFLNNFVCCRYNKDLFYISPLYGKAFTKLEKIIFIDMDLDFYGECFSRIKLIQYPQLCFDYFMFFFRMKRGRSVVVESVFGAARASGFHFCLREEIKTIKSFQFGHCPNYPPPTPQFGQLYRLFPPSTQLVTGDS